MYVLWSGYHGSAWVLGLSFTELRTGLGLIINRSLGSLLYRVVSWLGKLTVVGVHKLASHRGFSWGALEDLCLSCITY